MGEMIYLDRSATTPLSDAVKKTVIETMDRFGNPSSLHNLGVDAEHILTDAKKALLSALGMQNSKTSELIFTGGGSEANNLALAGVARAKAQNKGGRIITTAAEHPSVLECLKNLEKEGFEVVYIPAPRGVLDLSAFMQAMTPRTFLVSMMLVNNETGAVNDLAPVFSMAKSVNPNVVTHTDAVQAFMKLRFSPKSLGADLISISGHKIGAPKGVGALYVCPEVTKTKRLSPVIFGGGQENGMRAGTENTIGISAFATAAKEGLQDTASVRAVRERLISAIGDRVKINTPDGKYLPNILSVTLPDIKSETMLHFLSFKGIYVSSGSACSSHSKHQSHVLSDFGLSGRDSDCTLRLSFDASLTDDQIASVGQAFAEGIDRLAKMR